VGVADRPARSTIDRDDAQAFAHDPGDGAAAVREVPVLRGERRLPTSGEIEDARTALAGGRIVELLEKRGSWSTGGPMAIGCVTPVVGSTVWISPFELRAMRPFAAGPNGGGIRRWLPTMARAAASMITMSTATSAIPRQGDVPRETVRSGTIMGSHLSRKVQRGRCRTGAVCRRMSST
jgi:hypothetical protein